MRSAECGVWKMRSVENAECGKCGVWKMRSVENAECDNARGDRPHNLNRHETYVVTFYILALTSISFKDFPFLYERIGGCLNIWRSRG